MAAYAHQIRALIAGGVDMLLVETIFDSLNAKAALVAIRKFLTRIDVRLPVMISAAVGPRRRDDDFRPDDRGISECDAAHAKPLTIGLNCSLGPDQMRPFLEELAAKADAFVSVLSECRAAEPAVATGFRPAAGGHGRCGTLRAAGS